MQDIRNSTTAIIGLDSSDNFELMKGYTYDIYGKATAIGNEDFINDITFTGAIAEGGDIYYMHARFYDANTQRFLSQDTYKGNAWEPMSQNLYSYVGNNPVNYIDPTGHEAEGVVVYSDADIDDAFSAGTPTVTILVSQPIEGERTVGYIDGNLDLHTGHAFIRVDDGEGNVDYFGLYSNDNVKGYHMALSISVNGKIADDSGAEWDIGLSYEISAEEYEQIQEYIVKHDRVYNLESGNCTTFAVEALEAAGITDVTEEHNWSLLPDAVTNAPLKYFYGAAYLIYELTHYGYSPAGLAQDIRERE